MLGDAMGAAIRRYFGLHLQNLVGALGRLARQPFATLLTVLVIAIALALPAGLRVLVANASALSGSWQSAADFTAYFDLGVTEERARSISRDVEARDGVGSVRLIPAGAALEDFRAHSGFGEALDALTENPLPHTLIVRPASGFSGDVEGIAAALAQIPEIGLVQLDTQWVSRLRAMLGLARRVVDIAAILLGLAVAIVVGNTIRLEINNRSVEIEVTKLVGGSDGFIRRPFLYLGLCYGVAGALTAALLIGVALLLVGAPVRELAALYASDFRLAGLTGRETLALVAAGGVLGWAGAGLATARHLQAIEPK
jgi:cell division transport system permease protein